jgi:hypothetical protein
MPLPVRIKQQLMTLDAPLLRLELIADVLEQSGITGSAHRRMPEFDSSLNGVYETATFSAAFSWLARLQPGPWRRIPQFPRALCPVAYR